MADNIAITAGSGTSVATDDITDSGGAHYQKIKLADGTANSSTMIYVGNGGAANALRVTLANDSTGIVALTTGTASIGKLASNTGVDIGDVDVLSVIPGTGATNLGKAISTALGTTDTGVLALGVRDDTLNIRSDAENDCEPLHTDSVGALWVRNTPKVVRISVTPTIDTGVYASGDCIGGLQTISNAARASGGTGTILSVCVLDKTQAQRAPMDLLFFDQSVTVAGNNVAIAMSDADMANCLGVISIGAYNSAWPGTPLNSFSTLANVGLPFVLTGSANLYCQAVVRSTPTYTGTTDLVFIYTILQD